MGSYNNMVITTVGQALLTSVLGTQGTLTFSKFQTSSYQYSSGTDLSALTSLNNVEQTVVPSSAGVIDANNLYVSSAVDNDGLAAEYTAYTLGIFATDGNSEVLFGVSTAVTPDVIPADTGGTPSTYTYRMQLAVSSTDNITIDIDTGAYALASDLEDHVDSLILSNNGVHGVRSVQHGARYYIQVKVGGQWETAIGDKYESSITPSESNVMISGIVGDSATVTLTVVGDGELSIDTADPSIATASLSGTTLTITSVSGGSTTVTLSLSETATYSAATVTINVNCNVVTIGNTYFFGGFYWTAAEDLGNNAICMQSQGMTAGTWPAYKLTTDYTGTKNYGSADTAYNGNIDGDNIANYDATTQAWYQKYSAVEKTGASYGSGLFLVSNAKCGNTQEGAGSGNYFNALSIAATNALQFGAINIIAWLGTVVSTVGAWYIQGNEVHYSSVAQDSSYLFALAPAFNLDLTKVKLVDGDHIMLPTEEMPTLVTWANGTDAQISAMVEAADNGIIDLSDYWGVGDERTVTLSAMSATGVGESHAEQTATFALMHKGLYDLTTQTAVGRLKCAFIVGLKNSLKETGYMNDTNTNSGSWKNSKRRAWCNNVFYNAIPSSIRSIFKQFKTVTASVYNGSTNETTEDYFALPAGKEVFGADGNQGGGYSNQTEGNALTQFTYYATSANRIKKLGDDGSATFWWERSPYYDNAASFCRVLSDGSADGAGASSAYGLAPFGCI